MSSARSCFIAIPSVFSRTVVAGALLSLGLILPRAASAEPVVWSVGLQQAYDDNIFLEDPSSFTPVVEGEVLDGVENFDGVKNDDFITNISLGASFAPQVSSYFQAGISGRVGGILFNELSDQNRLTLDSNLTFRSTPRLLPEPYALSLTSALSSGQGAAGVAPGTAALQQQWHDATLNLSANGLRFVERSTVNLGYNLQRHDFLGELFLTSREPGDRQEIQGADFINNSVTSSIQYPISERLSAAFDNNISYFTFTSNGGIGTDVSALDRFTYNPAVGVNYATTQRTSLSGRVGLDITRFQDEPIAQSFPIILPDGTQGFSTTAPDQTPTNLFYMVAFNFTPDERTVLNAVLNQTAGVDITGNRVLTQSFAVNGSRAITDVIAATLGGAYTQFSFGNSLSGATDRVDLSASLRYSLTNAIALSLGYNFTTQSAGDGGVAGSFQNIDFESNRVFFGIDGGFLTLPLR